VANGREHIFCDATITTSTQTFIMPDYDEYGIAYKDRSALMSKNYDKGAATMYSHYIVIDGLIEGTWNRKNNGKTNTIETTPFAALSKRKQHALESAVKRYTKFFSENDAPVSKSQR
jgi:hypothetical protein